MHDQDHEHDHPDFEIGPNALVEEVEGLEVFSLTSVGIDIGSSTTHLVFSHLTLRREGASHSGRFKVTDRDVLYRSDILLTPYLTGTLIDTERVKRFIQDAYLEAGFTSEDIDTGAVVITGEALKKENARPIVEFFAQESGKFICASAGPNHEALLAAYGSGAVDLSKKESATVLNVDMGGGTTKFALIENGVVTETASINIGARLIAFDDSSVVTRVEEAGKRLLGELRHRVSVGKRIAEKRKEELATLMTRILFEVLEGSLSALAEELMVTEPLRKYRGLGAIDYLVFSGGVSEHIYDRDQRSYGDLGPQLGRKVRERLKAISKADVLREPVEGIRATVIGAGEYTIQASGSTSYISNAQALPVFGLKVVRVPIRRNDSVVKALRSALAKFDLETLTPGLALAFTVEGQPDYPYLRRIAEGILSVLKNSADARSPLYLALDLDVAKSLGAMLKEELKLEREIIAVDGIEVGDLDYIDIGAPMGITEVIPVTVKSLMFPSPCSLE